MTRPRTLPWLLAAAATTITATARAEPLRWQDHWGDAQPAEYALAATAGLFALLVNRTPVLELDWGYSGPDEAARGALRLADGRGRTLANQVSDVMFWGLTFYPVVDSLAALARDPHVGWQMLVLDGEVFALTAMASFTLQHVSGRARPFVRHCRGTPAPEHAEDCTASGRDEYFQSFPSGHALFAAAGAGLACAHHGALPLYGGGAADAAACIGAVTGTLVQGVLRVMADRHYASDVVFALGLGFGLGYGLPQVRYGGADPRPVRAAGSRVTVPLYGGAF